MQLKPLDDRVLVKPVESEEKTQSGIFLPDTAREKSQQGTVVAVGTDEDLQQKVKVGDRVLFTKFGGTEVKVDGIEHMLLSRSDVLAVVVD